MASSGKDASSSQLPELVLLVVLVAAAVWLATSAVDAPPQAQPEQLTPRRSPAAAASSARLPGAAGEVQMLALARRALYLGDSEQALTELEGYEKQFPRGRMVDDVALLRIEALVRQGEREQAARVAAPLLQRSPSSPQARRARTLLASTPSGR